MFDTLQTKQVRVKLLRMLTTWHCPLHANHAVFDRYLLPARPTATTCSSGMRQPDGTDRQTDTLQINRPCSAYYADSAIKNNKLSPNKDTSAAN